MGRYMRILNIHCKTICPEHPKGTLSSGLAVSFSRWGMKFSSISNLAWRFCFDQSFIFDFGIGFWLLDFDARFSLVVLRITWDNLKIVAFSKALLWNRSNVYLPFYHPNRFGQTGNLNKCMMNWICFHLGLVFLFEISFIITIIHHGFI